MEERDRRSQNKRNEKRKGWGHPMGGGLRDNPPFWGGVQQKMDLQRERCEGAGDKTRHTLWHPRLENHAKGGPIGLQKRKSNRDGLRRCQETFFHDRSTSTTPLHPTSINPCTAVGFWLITAAFSLDTGGLKFTFAQPFGQGRGFLVEARSLFVTF